jgi:hypothetical protein
MHFNSFDFLNNNFGNTFDLPNSVENLSNSQRVTTESSMSEFLAKQSISLEIASIQTETENPLYNRNDLHLKLNSTKACLYVGASAKENGAKRDSKVEENLKKPNYQGFLSAKTITKIKSKLDVWIDSINTFNALDGNRFKRKASYITFLTLTLPVEQKHTDKELNAVCLSPFIDKLRYHFNTLNYFWRAERQQNGNLHYHLLLDNYIDKIKVKELWNNTLEKLNYITEFEHLHNHRNPPTTDIRALALNQNPTAYFVKYALKKDDEHKINSRVWLASKSIINLKSFTLLSSATAIIFFKFLQKCNYTKTFENTYATTVCFFKSIKSKLLDNKVFQQYKEYMLLLYHALYRTRHEQDKNYQYKQNYNFQDVDLTCIPIVYNL